MAHVGVNRDFWRNRRVLLTGHTGFKGSWLALWLAHMQAKVHGFAFAPETNPNLFDRADVGSLLTDMRGDIRDLLAVRKALDAAAPEIVFHLAAQSLVRRSYRDPVGTFATNVMGTLNVLEGARQHNASRRAEGADGIGAIVVVTTDKCYENREWVRGYREADPLGGYDPYSASKGCAEIVTSSFRRSYARAETPAPPIATARAGNVIGGGDWSDDRLVPDIIRAFGANEPALIRNPHAIRPWQHVLEPLSAYLILAERLHAGEPNVADAWNFGPGMQGECAVGNLCDRMAALWGPGATWRHISDRRLHEAGFLRLDCSKAQQLLDWRPALGLDDALRLTVEWYRADQSPENLSMTDVTLGQIETYAALRSTARYTAIA